MTDEPDITDVLRECAAERNHVGYTTVTHELLTNAADEIERLRRLLGEWRDAGDLAVQQLGDLFLPVGDLL